MRFCRYASLGLILAASSLALAQDTVIPFRLLPDNYVHVEVSINGEGPMDFIFDTGADTCVLTEQGRKRLPSLKFASHEDTLGLGGKTSQPIEPGVSIRVNGFQTKQKLMFIDYRGGLKADGVLGYNVFADRTVRIDYDKMCLRITSGEVPNQTWEPVQMRDGLAFVAAKISDSHDVLFAIDTGFSGTASVTHEDASLAGLPGQLHVLGSGQLGGTGDRVLKTSIVELPTLSLGKLSLKDVPIDVQLASAGTDKRWSLLGNALLKRANLTWDIPGKRMSFSPNRLTQEPYALPNDSRAKVVIGVSVLLCLSAVAYVLLRRRKTSSPPVS